MLFIENRHIGNNVINQYYFIMKPFMHRLCNYFKFISYARTFYVINRGDKEEYVHIFKSLLDKMENFAQPCIMSGIDYQCSKFTAQELENLCDEINRIWFYWDDKQNYMKGHYVYKTEEAERFSTLGREYLKAVFSEEFDNREISMSLISDVSGKFYTDVWQPIQNIPYQYEFWQKQDFLFKKLALCSICFSMITLALILLLRFFLPIWIPLVLVIISMVCLGCTLFKLITLDDISRKILK